MTYYRIYCFGGDQHIQAFREAHCATDAEAVTEAGDLVARFSRVEVWDRGRLVRRLDGQAGPLVVRPVIGTGTCRAADVFGLSFSARRGVA